MPDQTVETPPGPAGKAATASPAPPPPPPALAPDGDEIVETAFAVLEQPLPPRKATQVVFGPKPAIEALVAAGAARAATRSEVELSHPFHYPLPAA
jgi:hypothetical protein